VLSVWTAKDSTGVYDQSGAPYMRSDPRAASLLPALAWRSGGPGAMPGPFVIEVTFGKPQGS